MPVVAQAPRVIAAVPVTTYAQQQPIITQRVAPSVQSKPSFGGFFSLKFFVI